MNPGRNYTIFGSLAGVREAGPPVVAPRGLPPDLGWEAVGDNTLFICETSGDGYTTPDRAAYYVEKCGSRYESDKQRVTHPDWHSHSWLTPKEWDLAIAQAKIHRASTWGMPEYAAISAALHELENYGDARIVFWFDN
jgi:hypothetical protein